MQRCCGPYSVAHWPSLAQAPQLWLALSQTCPLLPQSLVVWQLPETQALFTQTWLAP